MPARVIAGSAGGRLLKTPDRGGTRPTSDRVREALFEILAARGVAMTRVLDLYSGSGAMGIEALSRGARACDFVESDARACEVIKDNLRSTGFRELAHVFNLPVARALGRLDGPYDLVVADPPYEYDRAQREVAKLIERGVLAPDGVVAVEHSKRHIWPEMLAGRDQVLARRYGDTMVTLYQRQVN
jgi:16S rRNA (guanine966-N2)-methyltransferase